MIGGGGPRGAGRYPRGGGGAGTAAIIFGRCASTQVDDIAARARRRLRWTVQPNFAYTVDGRFYRARPLEVGPPSMQADPPYANQTGEQLVV